MSVFRSKFNGAEGALDRVFQRSFALACSEEKLTAFWKDCRAKMPTADSVSVVESSKHGSLDTLEREDVSDAVALTLTGGAYRWPCNMTPSAESQATLVAMVMGLKERGFPIDHLSPSGDACTAG